MRQLLGRPMLMAVIVLGSTCATTVAQESARTFQGGVTGSAPAGRLNPQAMNDPAVRTLIFALAEAPLTVQDKRGISLTTPLSAAYYQSSRNYPFKGGWTNVRTASLAPINRNR